MQISRNNYEEYFLLYIDGELSKADRNAVEQFVMLHPDLAEELELLKESMLPVDEMIQMPGKDLLMKQVEWNEEDVTPIREDLLLYIDNELSDARKTELELELAKDSSLSNELASLAKTKLVAESVEMPAKKELYRSERDRKPIPIRLTRWIAAAAAVIGLGWFSLAVLNKQPDAAQELAGNQSTQPSSKTTVPSSIETAENKGKQSTDQPVDGPVTVEYASADGAHPTKTKVINTVETARASTTQQTTIKPDERDLLENIPSSQLAVVTPPTGLEEGDQFNANKIGTPKVDVNAIPNAAVQQSKPADNEQASPYQYASYDENQEEENPYVNIAGARISKQKLRGVFRSVTRTVTRTFDKSTVTDANVASL